MATRVSRDVFRAACEYMIARGVKPTPTRLNLALGRDHLTGLTRRELNGRECKLRHEIFERKGWHVAESGDPPHWMPPADWQEIGNPGTVVNEVRISRGLSPYKYDVH